MNFEIGYNLFNSLEAIFWIVIAVILFVRVRYIADAFRQNTLYGGIVFFVFGVSDIFEIMIGGIFEPQQYWLLALKVICVLALIGLFIKYIYIRKKFRI